MKKTLVLVILFSALLFAEVSVSIPDTSLEQGLAYELPVLINEVNVDNQIISIELTLTWDEEYLSVNSISTSGTVIENWPNPIYNLKSDQITLWLIGSEPVDNDGVLIYFNVKIKDDAPTDTTTIEITRAFINEGSPTVVVQKPKITILLWDIIPPDPVDGLSITSIGSDYIDIQWYASGDDGLSGNVDSLDIRYTEYALNESNWNSATSVSDICVPLLSGELQNYRIDGLESTHHYYIGVKSIDDRGNISDLSNVVDTTTVDIIPPDISLLHPLMNTLVHAGHLDSISWISDDLAGINHSIVYYAIDGISFSKLDSVPGSSDTNYSIIWRVPNIISDKCLIKVSSVDNNGLSLIKQNEGYFSIIDTDPPSIEILSPQNNSEYLEHDTLSIKWNITDNIKVDSILIQYYNEANNSWTMISSDCENTGNYEWKIPGYSVTEKGKIFITAYDESGNHSTQSSDGYFKIIDNTPPEVDLLTQFSDSSFEIMSTRSIFWAATDNVAIQLIDIVYSINAGDTWISISENESNDGEYSWLIPDTPSDQCKIKIAVTDSVGLSDEAISDGLFTIYVTYPKLISHSAIISALDTIQLGFSQTLNIEQFNTGLALSGAIEENLTYDFQFLNNNQDVYIYPVNSFISGDTISLILSADQITNAYGYGLDGNQNDVFEGSPLDDDTVTVYVNYSGDFDSNDQVDFNDLALFANGWYSKDYKYELGPVTGDIPHFITMTDSLFNIEDAMTFGRMWNWFVGIGKHAITMPQLSFGGGFTTEQNGNDLIIHSRASAGKRIVLQYDPEIITINREQRSLTKPTDLTFEFYADCIDSNRSEYVHYSFTEEISNVPVIFTIKSKQRDPVNITIGVEGIDETGELILSDVITTQFQPIPDKFEVFPNYPNPFNSQTVIEYAIPVQSDVLINIYDLLGRKVRTLTNNRHEAKYYTLVWDGKDEQGRLAASGLYFLRIVARNENTTFIRTKKMVMIR